MMAARGVSALRLMSKLRPPLRRYSETAFPAARLYLHGLANLF